MATITITVSKNEREGLYYPPVLTDDSHSSALDPYDDENFTTVIQPGDNIIWEAGDGIKSIDRVFETPGSNNDLFDPDPAKIDGTWQGRIKEGTTGTEEYSITYTGDDDNQHTQDPKLSIGRH